MKCDCGALMKMTQGSARVKQWWCPKCGGLTAIVRGDNKPDFKYPKRKPKSKR